MHKFFLLTMPYVTSFPKNFIPQTTAQYECLFLERESCALNCAKIRNELLLLKVCDFQNFKSYH